MKKHSFINLKKSKKSKKNKYLNLAKTTLKNNKPKKYKKFVKCNFIKKNITKDAVDFKIKIKKNENIDNIKKRIIKKLKKIYPNMGKKLNKISQNLNLLDIKNNNSNNITTVINLDLLTKKQRGGAGAAGEAKRREDNEIKKAKDIIAVAVSLINEHNKSCHKLPSKIIPAQSVKPSELAQPIKRDISIQPAVVPQRVEPVDVPGNVKPVIQREIPIQPAVVPQRVEPVVISEDIEPIIPHEIPIQPAVVSKVIQPVIPREKRIQSAVVHEKVKSSHNNEDIIAFAMALVNNHNKTKIKYDKPINPENPAVRTPNIDVDAPFDPNNPINPNRDIGIENESTVERYKKASGKGTCYETNETKKIKNIIENLNNDCNSKSSKKK